VRRAHAIMVFVWDTAALGTCWWVFGWKAALPDHLRALLGD
jgi:hypothetical protein